MTSGDREQPAVPADGRADIAAALCTDSDDLLTTRRGGAPPERARASNGHVAAEAAPPQLFFGDTTEPELPEVAVARAEQEPASTVTPLAATGEAAAEVAPVAAASERETTGGSVHAQEEAPAANGTGEQADSDAARLHAGDEMPDTGADLASEHVVTDGRPAEEAAPGNGVARHALETLEYPVIDQELVAESTELQPPAGEASEPAPPTDEASEPAPASEATELTSPGDVATEPPPVAEAVHLPGAEPIESDVPSPASPTEGSSAPMDLEAVTEPGATELVEAPAPEPVEGTDPPPVEPIQGIEAPASAPFDELKAPVAAPSEEFEAPATSDPLLAVAPDIPAEPPTEPPAPPLAAAPPPPPAPPPPEEEEEEGATMTIIEHLEELRHRITISAISVVVAAVIGWFITPHVVTYLETAAKSVGGKFFSPTILGPFSLDLKLSFLIGVVIASPVVLYQVWAFVAPGLTRRERRYALPFSLIGGGLFAIGALTGVLVVPLAIRFLTSFFSVLDLEQLLDIGKYIMFITVIAVIFGITFELPIFMVGFSLLGVVNSRFFIQKFRIAIFIIYGVAMMITPGADFVSPLVLGTFLVVLYWLGVFLIRAIGR